MDKISKVDAMRFILNEVQNLKINRQELWDFMRLSKKNTGLPYSILVDNGGAYRQHGHDLWLYVEYDGKLFPVTISENPIVKVLANVKGLDFEPVFLFIRKNHRLLKNLADGKTMTDVFLSLLKRYDSLLESANSCRLLTKEEFEAPIWKDVKNKPSFIRRGQQVFNSVEERYGSGVARTVQFVDGVDCFYDDSQIDEFLEHAYQLYCRLVRAENEAKLREIFSDKEKINNLKSALEEIEKRDRSNED